MTIRTPTALCLVLTLLTTGQPAGGAERRAADEVLSGPLEDQTGRGSGNGGLVVLGSFNPADAGSLCGLAFDPSSEEVVVYECSGSTIRRYSSGGTFVSSVPRPGESANDVDLDVAPALTLSATPLAAGSILFINGETGPAEVYALDPASGTVLATLSVTFGSSHVVGGAYHQGRGTLFLVQDRVPGGTIGNRIAETDAGTGATLNTFQTTPAFVVNFGDLDVCSSTGNLLVVSSNESTIAELTPQGSLLAEHTLPSGVSGLSGIGIDDGSGEAWVSGTGGTVWRLGGLPCEGEPVPTVTPSPTPTPPTPTATPSPSSSCPGDCNSDGFVTIDELVRGVSISLGSVAVVNCETFDLNRNGRVGISELIRVIVNGALNGCIGS